MHDGDRQPDSTAIPPRPGQYTAGSTARHRSPSSTRRRIFFGLASIWGFIVGVVGLLVAMGTSGQSLAPDARLAPSLVPALVLAAAGSFVVAAAYNESKRRSR